MRHSPCMMCPDCRISELSVVTQTFRLERLFCMEDTYSEATCWQWQTDDLTSVIQPAGNARHQMGVERQSDMLWPL